MKQCDCHPPSVIIAAHLVGQEVHHFHIHADLIGYVHEFPFVFRAQLRGYMVPFRLFESTHNTQSATNFSIDRKLVRFVRVWFGQTVQLSTYCQQTAHNAHGTHYRGTPYQRHGSGAGTLITETNGFGNNRQHRNNPLRRGKIHHTGRAALGPRPWFGSLRMPSSSTYS